MAGLSQPGLPPAGSGTYQQVPNDSTVWAIGDSITANGYTAPNTTDGLIVNGQSYLEWAAALSGGALRWGGIAATGGYTSTQVLATHVPTVLAASPKPQYCLVLCGTNDATIGDATAKANMTSIWTTLARAGITPILCTLTPRNDYSGSSVNTITAFNHWIARQARLYGWPLVDLFAAVADPTTGQYTSGLNADNVHPNTKGAKTIGQAIAMAVTTIMAPQARTSPPLAVASTWPNVTNAAETNALNLTDTNTDGIPDQWALDFGSGATTTTSTMSASEGVGKWFNVTRAGVDVAYRTSGNMTLTAGRRMALGFKVKTSGLSGSGGVLNLRLTDTAGAHFLYKWDGTITEDITLGTVWHELDVPSALVTATFKFLLYLSGGNFTASIGQFTLVDLTAKSIYP